MTTDPNKTTGSLLSDALTHVSSLVRSEVDLARAEINDNLKSAGIAIGMIAGAVVVALTAECSDCRTCRSPYRSGYSRRLVGAYRRHHAGNRRLYHGEQRHERSETQQPCPNPYCKKCKARCASR